MTNRAERHQNRAGTYVSQPGDFRAFIPAALPPEPPIQFNARLAQLLSDADQGLGRLDGVASVLPNPDLFVAMYVRQEAVLSSQIEGTQSTLQDVLAFEGGVRQAGGPKDINEVVNYVAAMNHGLARLSELPLSLRLIREMHGVLLRDGRGQYHDPGNFRTSQNWIGSSAGGLANAAFVPPPPTELMNALGNLETFLHLRGQMPALVQAGLAHAQFETIHPFLDGNGRIGRLLITLFLCERGILKQPLLYLSVYLKTHRAEYYDRLTAIRIDGDWEGWLDFFLRGVVEVSASAAQTARNILDLREESRNRIARQASGKQAIHLLDFLFQKPVLAVGAAQRLLGCSFASANQTIRLLESHGLLIETTGQRRNRSYRFEPYLRLFADQPTDNTAPTRNAESR